MGLETIDIVNYIVNHHNTLLQQIIGVDMIFNVLLQGICDDENIIWDVCVKALGGTHDAAHLKQSLSLKRMNKERNIAKTCCHNMNTTKFAVCSG